MTLLDAAPRSSIGRSGRRLAVELFDGQELAAARWPSIAAGPELLMHVFQSREFLEVWMATIGRAAAVLAVTSASNSRTESPCQALPSKARRI